MEKDLKNLRLDQLTELVTSMGEKSYRAGQIFAWLSGGSVSFDEMTNVPGALREKLKDDGFHIDRLEILKKQESKTDGTRKYLFGLNDGNTIESVFMKYKYGNSICLSSQAGCRMGCAFCASGKNGLVRGLTPGEMLSQLLEAEADTGEKIGHIVVMGTGEPFDNYENLSAFLRIVNDKTGKNIGMRNITVSTCGLVPGIQRFSDDFPQVNLAVSLHGTTDEIRASMMPVNRKYPLNVLLSACREYTKKTGRRITFEYTLVNGVNDREEDMHRLSGLLSGMLCHVNLIPVNPIKERSYVRSTRQAVENFKIKLEKYGINVTIRREMGSDIDGACGQLRKSYIEKSYDPQ